MVRYIGSAAILVALGLLQASIDAEEAAPRMGRLCIAPLPVPEMEQAIRWRIAEDGHSTNYSVKIDGSDPLTLSTQEIHWVQGLDASAVHRGQILVDSAPLETFKFDFDSIPKGGDAKADLCLYMNGLYFTWQVSPVVSTGAWCPCWSREADAKEEAASSEREAEAELDGKTGPSASGGTDAGGEEGAPDRQAPRPP